MTIPDHWTGTQRNASCHHASVEAATRHMNAARAAGFIRAYVRRRLALGRGREGGRKNDRGTLQADCQHQTKNNERAPHRRKTNPVGRFEQTGSGGVALRVSKSGGFQLFLSEYRDRAIREHRLELGG